MTKPIEDRAAIEKYVRNNRVFILGAGFSAGAGVPLTPILLEKTMQKFSRECPGIFERVDNYAKESIVHTGLEVDYSQIDFSNLCTFLEYIELREFGGGERWSHAGSREKLALRFYLAKVLAECTPTEAAIPKIYLDFAAQLHSRDIVISFNWDGLLEASLRHLGKRYVYNFKDDDAIALCKLHGSINWRLGEPQNLRGPVNALEWKSMNFTDGMADVEMYHTPHLLDFDIWNSYQPLGEVQPFLVLPGYGKAFDVRSNAVLWYKPEFAFAATHNVFIVGLSLAPDDFFIRSFFLSNLPYIDCFSGVDGRRIYVINPDPNATKNYEFALKSGHAILIQEPFQAAHIDLMRASGSFTS